MNDTAIHIKVPQELYDRLKKEAEEKNISLAAIIRVICSDYFNSKK